MDSLISVCIPTYNNSLFVAQTIKSVLSQTFTNFEIIICDDSSTDNTVEIIKSFDDSRIHLFRNEINMGMHGNWNKVLSLAKGDFIKLVCGDDIIYDTCLEKQVHALSLDKRLAMVSARRNIINSEGKKSFGSVFKLPAKTYKGIDAIKYCVTFGTNLIGEPMAVLFRASILKDNKIVLGSNNYMIDLDMYSQLLMHGNLLVINEYLASFRVYKTSMSGSLGLKHAQSFNQYVNQKYISVNFKIGFFNKIMGKCIAFILNILRNIVFKILK